MFFFQKRNRVVGRLLWLSCFSVASRLHRVSSKGQGRRRTWPLVEQANRSACKNTNKRTQNTLQVLWSKNKHNLHVQDKVESVRRRETETASSAVLECGWSVVCVCVCLRAFVWYLRVLVRFFHCVFLYALVYICVPIHALYLSTICVFELLHTKDTAPNSPIPKLGMGKGSHFHRARKKKTSIRSKLTKPEIFWSPPALRVN